MALRSISAALLAFGLFVIFGAEQCFSTTVEQSDSPPDSPQLLQKMTAYSPDPCGPPYGQEMNWHSAEVESPLWERAADIVTQALNATAASPVLPLDRATEALKKLEQMSAEINAVWPVENRFHFQILDLPPAIVVKMTIRTHGRFFVFRYP